MKKLDIILISVMLLGATVLAILPQSHKVESEIGPHHLMTHANQSTKYVSPDKLAKSLMMADPSIILVDLRSEADYMAYQLPGAINMPAENILDQENLDILLNDAYTFVLYSEGSITPSKIWLLLNRIGYNNLKVLEGGLNNWVETILRPKPGNYMDKPEDVALYEFRQSASRYFGKGNNGGTVSNDIPKAAPVVKREKKETGGGGCD